MFGTLFLPHVELFLSIRLFVAVVLGALFGLERSLAGKHAGMRTYALVSLGSCVFSLVGVLASYQLAAFTAINPLLIASSIVVGVGFIGSGLAAGHGAHPTELTTASGIWVVAAVGMACGFGFIITAIATAFLGLLIFTGLSPVEQHLKLHWGKKNPRNN